jgi:hypothetical protein
MKSERRQYGVNDYLYGCRFAHFGHLLDSRGNIDVDTYVVYFFVRGSGQEGG